MELPFTHLGHRGRVIVSVVTTRVSAVLGAQEGAIDLANCTATIEFAGRGYLQLLGWVQLVRSTDNAFQGRQFEMDPFDPFGLYEHAPSPYCWYGITPTLFDAPSRDERSSLDWVAHSFLAVSPLRGNRRIVTPLLGFSWGFHVADNGSVALKPVTPLTAADWESHLPYLRGCYAEMRNSPQRSHYGLVILLVGCCLIVSQAVAQAGADAVKLMVKEPKSGVEFEVTEPALLGFMAFANLSQPLPEVPVVGDGVEITRYWPNGPFDHFHYYPGSEGTPGYIYYDGFCKAGPIRMASGTGLAWKRIKPCCPCSRDMA